MQDISFGINDHGEKYIPVWNLICAGRAAEGLREDWREQLKEVQKEIGFEYIRFHGIFHEDMMIYNEDKDGKVYYNWQYSDKLIDFLLEHNLHPIVELGFMPCKLATKETYCFWWKGNVSPPKDYDRWADLVREFAIHCINRYGLEEVLKWYFEVWNEPDGAYQGFWSGTQEEYFTLYEYSAKALKSIHEGLRVGGPASTPATLEGVAPWIEELMDYCEKRDLPIDFISNHPYPMHWPKDENGKHINKFKNKYSLSTDLTWMKSFISKSAYKNAEIHLTEWNSSPDDRDLVHDTAFMAPYIIYNNVANLGMTDSLGFWAFTDVFEENGAGNSIFHGGFGLINAQGIKKPSYYGYWFLSKLGNEKLVAGEDYIVCRRGDTIQVLMWNYCHYKHEYCEGDVSGMSYFNRYSIFEEKDDRIFNISLEDMKGDYKITDYYLDRDNGAAFEVWLQHGAIPDPDKEELDFLKRFTGPGMKSSIEKELKCYKRTLSLKPHSVHLIQIQKIYR